MSVLMHELRHVIGNQGNEALLCSDNIANAAAEACGNRTMVRAQVALCELVAAAIALQYDVCARPAVATSSWDGRLKMLEAGLIRTSIEVRCVTLWPQALALPIFIGTLVASGSLWVWYSSVPNVE